MTSENYSIKDLEKLSGIKAHTIRIWEKRYGIINPGRTDTNIRYYTNDDLKKLLNISLLNQNGYKISAISDMSSSEIAKKIEAISLVNSNGNEGIEENLLLSLIEMNEQQFNKIFHAMVIRYGFEESMIRVIFPFFNRIGIMWQAGTINPAQEHFFSNLIRNKIISATDGLTYAPVANAPIALLFLPEQELHEIGLLFYNYAMRSRQFKTIYLGQSVPHDSLPRVIATCNPAYIVCGMTNPASPQDFLTISRRLCKAAPGAKVFFTGPVPSAAQSKLPANAFLVKDLLTLLHITP